MENYNANEERQASKEEYSEESKSFHELATYFSELIYLNLPKWEVSKIGANFDPPIFENFSTKEISGKCVTTYPILFGTKDQHLGDPIADAFCVTKNETSTIVSLSDGCSWGKK